MLDPTAIRLLEFCDYLISESQANNTAVLDRCQTPKDRVMLMEEFGVPATKPSDVGYTLAHYDSGDIGIQAAVSTLVDIVSLAVIGAAYPAQIPAPGTTPDFTYSSFFNFLARLLTYPPLLQELQQYSAASEQSQLQTTLQAYQLTNSFNEHTAITTLVSPNAQSTPLAQNTLTRAADLVTSMNQLTNAFQQRFKFF